ncbi:MAG: DUF1491 family protein [Pseudomonadota bacterium]
MSVRLATGVWVDAYRAQLSAAHIPCYITARGDAVAGAVVVKCAHLDGTARAFQRSFDATGARVWMVMCEGPEAEVDAQLSRARQYDPDLWIIEIESREGITLLGQGGLE